jgi:molybdopterin-guanine dinucleotide biosynthesis adapter protein
MVEPIIFQVVGYQNSGKTTFISKLIAELSKEKWRVITIKHHGHGGQPDLVADKDTSKHSDAGAIASLVEGNGRLILHAEQSSWSLAQQIQLATMLEPDFIIIEGHKKKEFPKVVLLREQDEDRKLLQELENIKAVFYWQENYPELVHSDIPSFQINEEQGLSYILNFLISMRSKAIDAR